MRQVGKDTLVTIQVKTRQSINLIHLVDGELFVYVKDPPVKNKANKTIINLMRKRFKTKVVLESGQTSTTKVLRISNIEPFEILEILK